MTNFALNLGPSQPEGTEGTPDTTPLALTIKFIGYEPNEVLAQAILCTETHFPYVVSGSESLQSFLNALLNALYDSRLPEHISHRHRPMGEFNHSAAQITKGQAYRACTWKILNMIGNLQDEQLIALLAQSGALKEVLDIAEDHSDPNAASDSPLYREGLFLSRIAHILKKNSPIFEDQAFLVNFLTNNAQCIFDMVYSDPAECHLSFLANIYQITRCALSNSSNNVVSIMGGSINSSERRKLAAFFKRFRDLLERHCYDLDGGVLIANRQTDTGIIASVIGEELFMPVHSPIPYL